MNKFLIKASAVVIIIALIISKAHAQKTTDRILLDQVVAVVGTKVILYSDVENEYLQSQLQGSNHAFSSKCSIMEELMLQKLLLHQAEIDSVEVTDKQVESELDRRLRYFISQIGSKEKLEEYFNKSLLEIKEDLRPKIKDYLLIQNVQSKITQDIKITPSEVSAYYKSIPADSIPLIGSQLEVSQIVSKPEISNEEIELVKEKLNSLRNRILKGDDFATLANLYSEDPGSMSKGGEIGFVGRGELFPEFEAAAFALKPGEVSPVIKTEKGFHIIKLIERRGEFINVRHILMIPKPSAMALAKAKKELENIASLISMDSISFEKAAIKYSDDPSGMNGGKLVNNYSGDSKFLPDELETSVFFAVDKLKPGEFSAPVLFTTEDGTQAYRILFLKARTAPHKANLKDDYPQLQTIAQAQKQSEAINKWVIEKSKNVFVRILDEYNKCNFKYHWISY